LELNVITFEGISKRYKEGLSSRFVTALDDLTLEVGAGEVFGFLGPNGAGKSTAIKILINLIFPDSGRALINGQEVGNKDVRGLVGFLPENPYFYDYLTAEELLRFGGQASGLDASTIKQRTDLLLTKVNLDKARKSSLRTYSKGMVQRAGLAMALIHDPQVVILDEPMSGLDPLGRKMVGDIIIELKQAGKTVFFSSHILSDVERFCDRAGIIVGGRLRRVENMDSLLATGATLESVFLEEVEKAGQKEVN
jgi:ABC-2 type transport system ATP-binding protein